MKNKYIKEVLPTLQVTARYPNNTVDLSSDGSLVVSGLTELQVEQLRSYFYGLNLHLEELFELHCSTQVIPVRTDAELDHLQESLTSRLEEIKGISASHQTAFPHLLADIKARLSMLRWFRGQNEK